MQMYYTFAVAAFWRTGTAGVPEYTVACPFMWQFRATIVRHFLWIQYLWLNGCYDLLKIITIFPETFRENEY